MAEDYVWIPWDSILEHCEHVKPIRDVIPEFYVSLSPSSPQGGSWQLTEPTIDNTVYSLDTSFTPTQSGSGTPSPDNVRPIVGRDEVVVYDDPKYGGTIVWNQLQDLLTGYTVSLGGSGLTISLNNGYVDISGTATERCVLNTAPAGSAPANHVLLFRAENYNGFKWGRIGFSGYSAKDILYKHNAAFSKGAKFDIAEGDTVDIHTRTNCYDLTLMFGSTIADHIYALEQATAGAGVAWFKALFPKSYYPYNAGEETTVSAVNGDPYTTTPVPLGQTVYGGVLDVTNGELTVTYGIVDLGTLNWIATTNNRLRSAMTLSNAKQYAYTESQNVLCTALLSDSDRNVANQITDKTIAVGGSAYLYVYDYAYRADPAAFKQAMSGVMLAYELATPTTVQIPPTEIELFLGQNNIWSDTGENVHIATADDEQTGMIVTVYGKTLWMRSHIFYKDGTDEYTTPIRIG